MKKRILSLALAILLFCMLPLSMFAENGDVTVFSEFSTALAPGITHQEGVAYNPAGSAWITIQRGLIRRLIRLASA